MAGTRSGDRRGARRGMWVLLAVLACGGRDPAEPMGPVDQPAPRQTSYHVTPIGRSEGSGRMGDPLDLASALGSGSPAAGGDTIWVHEGVYEGQFVVSKGGTASEPLVVRAVPGARARIRRAGEGLAATLRVEAGHVWLWGLEVDGAAVPCATAVNLGAEGGSYPGIRLINLYVHDSGVNGVGAWSQAPDAEVYGSVLFNNGHDACSPDGRLGYGHGIYVQNTTGSKRIEDNLILDTFGYGLHAYTQGGELRDIAVIGNVFARNRHGFAVHMGGNGLVAPEIGENMIYATGSGLRVGDLFAPAQKPVVRDNYVVLVGSPWPAFAPLNVQQMTFQRNTLIRTQPTAAGTIQQQGSFDAVGWSDNTYRGLISSGEFQWLDPAVNLTMTWAEFHARYPTLTASDRFLPLPVEPRVFVRANRYEPGRGNIVVFNWGGAEEVSVELPETMAGRYEIRDAHDFAGTPVAAGEGGIVSIPLNGAPFGVYVLLPR